MMGALAVCLRVLASLLSGAAPAGYRLTMEVENVRNTQGVVGVLVFNTTQGWPEQFSAALRAEATAAHKGVVEITVPDLPAGDYAVVALHDELRRMVWVRSASLSTFLKQGSAGAWSMAS
jgi:uncharacterized protein (DUF2141 family)